MEIAESTVLTVLKGRLIRSLLARWVQWELATEEQERGVG
jgi:hypothetical protein